MPSKVTTAVQGAVTAFLASSGCTYRPGRLAPLQDPLWRYFAAESTDPATKAMKKSIRLAYRQMGETTLAQSVMLVLREDLIGKPKGFLKTVQHAILSRDVLKLVMDKVDPRLAKDVARVDIGFQEYVGGLLVEEHYDTGKVARTLWPVLAPLIEVAGSAYLGSTNIDRGSSSPEPEVAVSGGAAVSGSTRKSKAAADHQFLLNAWSVQQNPAPSPPRTPSETSPDADGEGNSHRPFFAEDDLATFLVPAFSPTSFSPQASSINHGEILSMDLNLLPLFKADSDYGDESYSDDSSDSARGTDSPSSSGSPIASRREGALWLFNELVNVVQSPAGGSESGDLAMTGVSPAATTEGPIDTLTVMAYGGIVLQEVQAPFFASVGIPSQQAGSSLERPSWRYDPHKASAKSSKMVSTPGSHTDEIAGLKNPGRSPLTLSNGRSPGEAMQRIRSIWMSP
ncbi:hypothetical protein DFH06DRAFT_1410998 [Mycena polygramma]|nr:hypothetical protein DFH06DRAFT_1410998 [Mycena polygramma]